MAVINNFNNPFWVSYFSPHYSTTTYTKWRKKKELYFFCILILNLWYCNCANLFSNWEPTEMGFQAMQTCSRATAHSLRMMVLCIGRMVIGLQVGKNREESDRNGRNRKLQWRLFTVFSTWFHLSCLCVITSSPRLADGPSTAQARVAHRLILPHVFDTAPIWQQK